MNRCVNSFIIPFLFAASFLVTSLSAQVPRRISYQGYVTNTRNEPISGSYSVVIKLYSKAGAELYTETFPSLQFTDGVFDAVLGGISGLPSSIAFDEQYALGVSIDGGPELTPRTPFASAPYALRADVANTLAPGGSIVTKVNNLSGALKIVGGGATTVTQSHDTIFISSSGGGGGSGIQGVQNSDGTLLVTNPNGPIATINLQSVPLTTLAAGGASFDQVMKFNGATWTPATYTVSASARFIGNGTSGSPLDLASQGAAGGDVLKWSGTAWVPGSDNIGTLTLPYTSTTSSSSTLFSITNSGTGRAGYFAIANTANTTPALTGETNTSNTSASALYGKVTGTNGIGALLEATNAAYAGTVLSVLTAGTGKGATITSQDAANSANVLEVTTSGTGKAGYFRVLNNSSSASAIEASTSGTGHTIYSSSGAPSASAIFGFHGSSGIGVTGSTNDGTGVYGYSMNQTGVRGIHNAATGSAAGVEGKTSSTTAGASAFGAGANGIYGEVSATAPGAWTAGVRGYNKGTAGNGVGVIGVQDGTGYGVYGESAGAGTGVYGKSTAAGFGGYFDVPVGGAGWGVVASTAAKPGGGVWAVFSDRDLKRDIRPFADGLNIIERIDPVWYTYNGKGGMPEGESFVGIVAQDMQPLMPYAVRSSRGLDPKSDERYLSFDASALTYMQINAIKELAAKLDAMQTRIQELEALLRERGIDPVPTK